MCEYNPLLLGYAADKRQTRTVAEDLGLLHQSLAHAVEVVEDNHQVVTQEKAIDVAIDFGQGEFRGGKAFRR